MAVKPDSGCIYKTKKNKVIKNGTFSSILNYKIKNNQQESTVILELSFANSFNRDGRGGGGHDLKTRQDRRGEHRGKIRQLQSRDTILVFVCIRIGGTRRVAIRWEKNFQKRKKNQKLLIIMCRPNSTSYSALS